MSNLEIVLVVERLNVIEKYILALTAYITTLGFFFSTSVVPIQDESKAASEILFTDL